MPIPPGQNPFFLTKAHDVTNVESPQPPRNQSHQQAALPPRPASVPPQQAAQPPRQASFPPRQASLPPRQASFHSPQQPAPPPRQASYHPPRQAPVPPRQASYHPPRQSSLSPQPYQNPGMPHSPRPSNHPHPQQAVAPYNANFQALSPNVRGNTPGPAAPNPHANLRWRVPKPGTPRPKPPSFNQQMARMNPNYQYPFPPPQPPRQMPGNKKRSKPNAKKDAWRAAEAASRAEWEVTAGQMRQSRRGGRRDREAERKEYVAGLNMEGSWGNKKSSCCVIM
ncbi:unnamed protein product [Zymoseptoria tritici ST99CH_1A5]|uniref:Uncharacterized protein n=1 Tax=Zymoseptoria tritici ST99CH_1A5 TaxID=1276529 RepID=A0A1Y6LRA3_ZYMTR|nr:unnamed protein product [Zymoseptoria tritici ST99CH_1A5]